MRSAGPSAFATLLDACAIAAVAPATQPVPGTQVDYAPANLLRDALGVVAGVDAGAVVLRLADTEAGAPRGDAIVRAVRAARLRALRAWRRTDSSTAAAGRSGRARRP